MKRALVVVAHPDDELIYFGNTIMKNPDVEWHVVCVTDGNGQGTGYRRINSFKSCCQELGVFRTYFLHLLDVFSAHLNRKLISDGLRTIFEDTYFDFVYTHNVDEWHWHHREVAVAVGNMFKQVWVPIKTANPPLRSLPNSRKAELFERHYSDQIDNADSAIRDYWSENLVKSELTLLDCLPADRFNLSDEMHLVVRDHPVYTFRPCGKRAVAPPMTKETAEVMSLKLISRFDTLGIIAEGSSSSNARAALSQLLGMWLDQWRIKGKPDHSIKMLGLVETVYQEFLFCARVVTYRQTKDRNLPTVLGMAIIFEDEDTVYDALAPWRAAFSGIRPGILMGVANYCYASIHQKNYDLGYGAEYLYLIKEAKF